MLLIHDRHGRTQQSFEESSQHYMCSIRQDKDHLTYVEHYPPCRASTFGNVYSAHVCRIGGDSEYFTLKTDWEAMVVLGFVGFAAGFNEGMTGKRLGVSMSLTANFVVEKGEKGKGKEKEKERTITWSERSDVYLKI